MTWTDVIPLIKPELVLIVAACALFLLGASSKAAARKIAPVIALLALVVAFVMCFIDDLGAANLRADAVGALRLTEFGLFIKLISAGVGALFVLLAWPSDEQATGNSALEFGHDAGEFFALLLLAVAGLFLVAGANDIILLFLGIELASIPTYIMVSVSRPLPAAQEAGLKYFFLGAMSAAVMLFGFSYLYGSTGLLDLNRIAGVIGATAPGHQPTVLSYWQALAVLMLITGFAFKMAAFPMHFYAGDVYEGAATPVTALLSFVPKASGFVALIKILFVISGGVWIVPDYVVKLMWILAVLTMTVGNVLGLLQQNVKRMLAYSSIAHSGYMLVAVTALLTTQSPRAIEGVLFYLTAYGLMNVAAFGVLMMLPARHNRPATSAETFEDIAGAGRRHVGLGLAMAVACFSLTGLPLTVGFFGKVYLIRPALAGEGPWAAWNYWLVAIMMINAAISAGYYLRVVGVMFLRTEAQSLAPVPRTVPVMVAIGISTVGMLLFGAVPPATQILQTRTVEAAEVDQLPARATLTTSQP